ncbi:MAG: MDR family MFS transporter [Beijerinckiaceae bacterium]
MTKSVGEGGRLGHREVRSIIFGLLLAMLLAALDQTIIATALPTIGQDLHDLEHLPWIIAAYLLASTAVTPLYGKLSDIHGRRPVLLAAIATFIIGSVACALAPTMFILVLARGLQGVGGGGLISLAQTIIADIVSPRERGRYQVYFASVFITSSLAGPVLGGFFAEHVHWSAIFWINVPLGLGALAMTNSKLKHLPQHQRPHRLDLIGAALLVVGSTSLLLALSWGGVRYPWLSREILFLSGLSCLFWIAFFVRSKTASEPLIPISILQNQVVRTGTLSACFAMGIFIGLSIFMPLYFEGVKKFSASVSGLALIPLMIGTVVGATISGRSMAIVSHYKRLPLIGLLFTFAATVAMAFSADFPIALIEMLLAIISVGLGTVLPVTTVAIQNSVRVHELGTATASMNFFRQLGGAFIVAIFGTIVLNGTGSAGTQTVANGLPPAELLGAFHSVFIAASAGVFACLLFLLRMEERPLLGRRPDPLAEAGVEIIRPED